MNWFHTQECQLRIRRAIWAAEVPLRSEQSQLHIGPPSLDHQCWEEKSPHLAVKAAGIPSM